MECLQQLCGVCACVFEERQRESVRFRVHDLEAIRELLPDDVLWFHALHEACMHPAVHREGGELSFEHGARLQEHMWRLNMAADHLLRPVVEIPVMRAAVGDGEDECVAITASCTAHTLQILRLIRWDR